MRLPRSVPTAMTQGKTARADRQSGTARSTSGRMKASMISSLTGSPACTARRMSACASSRAGQRGRSPLAGSSMVAVAKPSAGRARRGQPAGVHRARSPRAGWPSRISGAGADADARSRSPQIAGDLTEDALTFAEAAVEELFRSDVDGRAFRKRAGRRSWTTCLLPGRPKEGAPMTKSSQVPPPWSLARPRRNDNSVLVLVTNRFTGQAGWDWRAATGRSCQLARPTARRTGSPAASHGRGTYRRR